MQSSYRDYKVIISGPSGAGKSTAIAVISDTSLFGTDVKPSDRSYNQKPLTTVALDFGVIHVSEQERVHLYGTPGQERFGFMWEILSYGGLGLILLLDNSRSDPLRDLSFFLDTYEEFIGKTKIVIGVAHMALNPLPSLEDYHERLKDFGLNPALFEVDARNKNDLLILLQSLLFSIDPGF